MLLLMVFFNSVHYRISVIDRKKIISEIAELIIFAELQKSVLQTEISLMLPKKETQISLKFIL